MLDLFKTSIKEITSCLRSKARFFNTKKLYWKSVVARVVFFLRKCMRKIKNCQTTFFPFRNSQKLSTIFFKPLRSHADLPHVPLLPPPVEQAAAHGVPHPGHPVRGGGLPGGAGLPQRQEERGRPVGPHPALLQPALLDGAGHHGTVRTAGQQYVVVGAQPSTAY